MLSKHRDKWMRYKKRHDKNARKELICEFLPLVHYVFGRMSVYLPTVLDEQDLVAAGVIGLISAVNDFDVSRDIEFTTFAVPRIRGAILDELRGHDWVPRTARRRAAELAAALAKARKDQFDAPDMAKVARILGIEQSELSKLMLRTQSVSFVPLEHASEDDNDESMCIAQVMADRKCVSPQDEVEHNDLQKVMLEALSSLPPTEKEVLVKYYFDEKMQKDIARQLKVSRSRVSQIHNHAIDMLKEKIEAVGAA